MNYLCRLIVVAKNVHLKSHKREKTLKCTTEWTNKFFCNVSEKKEQKYKIGIIGCGPSALYCCKYFFKNENIKVDIFDKLPNPYGLIRYGVAPDHINVKNIYKTFDAVLSNKNFRFFGNVHIGKDIKIEELKNYYNVCLFCCGASSRSFPPIKPLIGKNVEEKGGEANKESIPNEPNGIFHARDIIFFYNNYYKELRDSNVQNYLNNFSNFENAVIIGNGNVSLDVARILNKHYNELKTTDINDEYLHSIKKHSMKHIYIIGRKGLWQSSFTNSELREMLTLQNTKVILNKKYYDMCFQLKDYDENDKVKKRQTQLFLTMMQNYEELEKNKNLYKDFKIIEFIFYHQIKQIHYLNDYLKSIEFEKNKNLHDSPTVENKRTIVTPLLIFATGFKKNAFNQHMYEHSVAKYKEDICLKKFGIFKSGWFDTGAKGNIASQIINAKGNTSQILQFLKNVETFYYNDICDLLKQKKIRYVPLGDWLYIHNYEQELGLKKNKVSQKMDTINRLFQVLDAHKKNE